MLATDQSLLWKMMSTYIQNDLPTIQRQITDHVEYTLACDRSNFSKYNAYQATAYSARDRLIEFYQDSNFRFAEANSKRVYYLSIEYLLGRSLGNALLNLGVEGNYGKALKQFGFGLEDLADQELDAGLGNGGLGRLAACFLDSMATKNYAAWGYGIRYTYGMFRQQIFQGWQAEIPDLWLKGGNPWEVTRLDRKFNVRLGGNVRVENVNGKNKSIWENGEVVVAVAYDTPIPGYDTSTCINLRLWSSEPTNEFDLASFNDGNYYKAIERRQSAEAISSVLYPNDNTEEGKILRLKQQYFFCSATLQDIIRRFLRYNSDWKTFPEKVAVQLNDTHPTISIPELMRLLIDEHGLEWDAAEAICRKTFAYTNHTVMPEALEKWSVPVLERLLPRHLEIVYEINARFINFLRTERKADDATVSRLSIIQEGNPKFVRMANMAVIFCHHVNGVAALHTEILKDSLFHEYHEMFPGKLVNVTNGITPRRWLSLCNPRLTKLITKTLGSSDFLTNLDLLEGLRAHANDAAFQQQWAEVKLQNKKTLAKYLETTMGITVDPNALFDIQVKRIHEYKRQLMNILRVIYQYKDLRTKAAAGNLAGCVPRVVIFAGKAAPAYFRAKHIIKLINAVSERVNADTSINNLLKVVFMPNYNVSLAEKIIPANDISEHISTAGTEASGTSNMKFALNAGLIVGTLDGANIEIRDAIGHENMFIFGLLNEQINATRAANSTKHVIESSRLQEAVNEIRSGVFGDPSPYFEICDNLIPSRDHYLLGNDFDSFYEAHQTVEKEFQNKGLWTKKCIMSTAGMGKFSSDRSVQDYAKLIWNVEPLEPNLHGTQ